MNSSDSMIRLNDIIVQLKFSHANLEGVFSLQ